MFELKDKVAIVTGGASGIGYAYVKEFLRNGVKGVAIVDINKIQGNIALVEFEKEFGPNKIIFICADITNKIQLRESFEKTVDAFKKLDILVNNAGIIHEIDWKRCIAVNLIANIEASTLAMDEFFPKYKSGPEGVIISTASSSVYKLLTGLAVYTATKCGIVGFTQTAAITYSDIKNVRFIAICPDGTDTPITNVTTDQVERQYLELAGVGQSEPRPVQSPETVAIAAMKLIRSAYSGSVWIISYGNLTEVEKVPLA